MFKYTQAELIALPIALLITVFLGVIIGWLLRKKSNKIKNLALISVIGIMLVMEVFKQVISIKSGSYDLWNIPLHYCSMFMLWFSLAAFSKGRVKEIGMSLANATALLFLLLFYFAPTVIIGSASESVFGSFGAFHTFFYHHFIILFWLLQITLKLHKPKWADLKWIFIAFVIYFVVVTTAGNLLDTNFTNILFSNISILDNVRINFGYGIYLALMFIFGTGGTMLAHTLTMLGYKLKKQSTNK